MIPNAWTLSTAQIAIETAAILAFAASGLIEAARKKLDVVGVCIVVGLSAFGGGTLRDILLDRRPFFWVEHSVWLWMLLGLSILAMFFLQARHFAPTERAMQWPDALGLGLFTAGGTQLAIAAAMPAVVAVLMGMVTAVFGGRHRLQRDPPGFSRPSAVCHMLVRRRLGRRRRRPVGPGRLGWAAGGCVAGHRPARSGPGF